MSKLEKAKKALELAKKQQAEKGKKTVFLKPGVSGYDITGKKNWG